MICATALQYHEKAVAVVCHFCGCREQGHITCPHDHYICDHCHNEDALQVIENIIYTTGSTAPQDIAELAMSFPGLPMLGCQHAYIAGGALMAALKNAGAGRFGNDDIKEVLKRTGQQAHGGYCGLTGVCGIVPAVGAVFAVLTGSKCGTDEPQRRTMEAVCRVSRVIADLTGPSCCKAYVRAALAEAMELLQEDFAIRLPVGEQATCLAGPRHPHGCRQERCPFQGSDRAKAS